MRTHFLTPAALPLRHLRLQNSRRSRLLGQRGPTACLWPRNALGSTNRAHLQEEITFPPPCTRGRAKMEPFVLFGVFPPVLRPISVMRQLWSWCVFPCFKGISAGLGSWNPEFTICPFRARKWPSLRFKRKWPMLKRSDWPFCSRTEHFLAQKGRLSAISRYKDCDAMKYSTWATFIEHVVRNRRKWPFLEQKCTVSP